MAFPDDQIKFARKAADQTRDAVLGFFNDHGGIGAGSTVTANTLSSVVLVLVVVITVIIGILFRIGSQVAALVLTTLEETRHDNQDSMNTLIAASMSDLLSVEITADDIPKGGNPGAQLDRARVIGGKLHDLLITEFGGGNGPDSVDGKKAARAFTGFNVNFSTGAALLSVLTEISTVGFIKEFREIGEQMAQGLSLGRLHRAALKPLIDALIVHPYTRQLGAEYRQTRLSEQEYTDALQRGDQSDISVAGSVFDVPFTADPSSVIDQPAYDKHMQEKGYTDQDIGVLNAGLRRGLSPSELELAVRHGVIGPRFAIEQLVRTGLSPALSKVRLRSIELQRVDAVQQHLVSDAFNLARARHMTEADFQTLLDSTNLIEPEKQAWAQRLSIALLHPSRRPTLLELLYLSERHQITEAEVDKWAEDSGFDAQGQAIISLYVLGKDLDFDAAQKMKSDKATKAATTLKQKIAAAIAAAEAKEDA